MFPTLRVRNHVERILAIWKSNDWSAQGMETLRVGMDDPDTDVRIVAIEAFAAICQDMNCLRQVIAARLSNCLAAREAATLIRAAAGMIPDQSLVDLYLGYKHHEDADVRSACLEVSGSLFPDDDVAPKPVVEYVLECLSDENPGMRYLAVRILGKWGASAKMEPVVAMVHDADWEVRHAAYRTLMMFAEKDPDGIMRYVDIMLAVRDADVALALSVLDRCGWCDPKEINCLFRMVCDGTWDAIRIAAPILARAVKRASDPAAAIQKALAAFLGQSRQQRGSVLSSEACLRLSALVQETVDLVRSMQA